MRLVQPVSTLMIWRWVTGEPVTRIYVPLSRISPTLPLAVIIAEDGRFCGHHGVDLAGNPRRHGGRRRSGGHARRLDHHPAGGQEPVPLAGPQLRAQGAGIPAGAVDRPDPVQAADPGDLSQHRRMGPERRNSAPRRAAATPSASPPADLSRYQAALLAAILPNPHERNARVSPVPACGGSPNSMSPAPRARRRPRPACAKTH